MRRALLTAALAALSVILVSCADMPTAPRGTVQVTGSITDRNGTGIQAVYVTFEDLAPRSAHTDPASYFTVTDLNGLYSASMPEGTYRVWLDPPAFSGYAPTFLDSRTVSRPSARIDYRCNFVRMAVHPTISGGQTAADLQVETIPIDNPDAFWYESMRLAGAEREIFVPPGRYDLMLNLTGKGFGYPFSEMTVQVAADTTIAALFSGYAVTGHVTGPGGTPMPDGYLYVSSPDNRAQARLDANGAAILYLPAGTYRFSADPDASNIMGRSISGVAINGDASLNFDLSGTEWKGVIRRVSDGTPLAQASMSARLTDSYSGAYDYTGDDGAFDVVVQSGQSYTLAVYDGQNGNVLYRSYNVPAGADSTFDILVDPNAPLQGVSGRSLMPILRAAPDAPASAAAGPGSRRRSSRTSG